MQAVDLKECVSLLNTDSPIRAVSNFSSQSCHSHFTCREHEQANQPTQRPKQLPIEQPIQLPIQFCHFIDNHCNARGISPASPDPSSSDHLSVSPFPCGVS